MPRKVSAVHVIYLPVWMAAFCIIPFVAWTYEGRRTVAVCGVGVPGPTDLHSLP
jgi:hypothetical protein